MNEATQKFAGKPGELVKNGKWTGAIRLLGQDRMKPKGWKTSKVVAVCWLADLWSRLVPMSHQLDQIDHTFKNARDRDQKRLPQHHFLYLTSRPEAMAETLRIFLQGINSAKAKHTLYCSHWFGWSSWDQQSWNTGAQALRALPVHRWTSVEPILRPINPGIEWAELIDWVVMGAETGPEARPARAQWFQMMRDWCWKWDIPFYLKQLSGGLRSLDGRTHDAFPWGTVEGVD